MRMKMRFEGIKPARWIGRFILPSDTILTALKKMDAIDRKLLIVSDGIVIDGLLSIGDIQRAIIKNLSMDRIVSEILRESVTYVDVEADLNEIRSLMLEYRMELCPVVNREGVVVDIHFW